ncbi:MAG TPA: hypothetical protein VJL80_09700 [Aeromicrobium sp.]|nr:hypothetical protein [Aeromicrobium sp.]HKY58299.1 hypothetical protein [Aeromicrobium sp.]
MHNTLLPTHPTLLHPITGEPLQAIGLRPNGAPLWPIMGGDGTGPDANDDPKDDDDADDPEDDDPKDDDDKDVDWRAKFEAEQRHKRNLERKARKDAATIARLTGKKPEGGGKDDAPDADELKAQAKAEARAEVLRERVEDKIEAKARAFADPEDAVAVLLRQHDINDFLDDGKVDVEAIADALKELGEKKPHLLAKGSRFKGDADGGPRKDKTPSRPKNLGDAIARHYDNKS